LTSKPHIINWQHRFAKEYRHLRNILNRKKYQAFDLVWLFWCVAPHFAIVKIVLYLISASLPTLTILATASFIDNALNVVKQSQPISTILPSVLVLFAIQLVYTFQEIIDSIINTRRKIYLRIGLQPQVIERVASLDYKHIENQETADLLHRVVPEFAAKIANSHEAVLQVARQIISMAGVAVTITLNVWWAGVITFISAVPLLWMAKKAGDAMYQIQRENSKIYRKAFYLYHVLSSRDAVEERTVYEYSEPLSEKYRKEYRIITKSLQGVSVLWFWKQKAYSIFASIVAIAVIGSMIPSVLSGDLDYGMFVALAGGMISLTVMLSWGINWHISQITEDYQYLKDLTKFVNLETVEGITLPPKKDMSFTKIVFDNVSFAYPGTVGTPFMVSDSASVGTPLMASDSPSVGTPFMASASNTPKLILDGVSFTIEQGKHYAFVGVNGAGKTTIVKLLTGLYTNYTGEIYIDDRNLRDLYPDEIKGLCSVIYQDFARYSFSLYDNIAIANPSASENDIFSAASIAGLDTAINKLPEGIHTNLGKVYENGSDISGGEWQRVAIARSIVNPAPLRILDEPTAALDPISESQVYEQFEEISRGQTTIFISHRLGSTKLADTIFVLADGKLTEQGSHFDLMSKDGLYAEMFATQAEWYGD